MRPDFFTDDKMGRMSVASRLTYIGLWCIADDAGWMPWDTPSIAAQLYPFESVRVRERRVAQAKDELVALGRLDVLDCGCVVIPTLPLIQKNGGNKAMTQRDRHDATHKKPTSGRVQTFPDVYDGRYVGSEVGNRAGATNDEAAELRAAFRRQGLPVDAA